MALVSSTLMELLEPWLPVNSKGDDRAVGMRTGTSWRTGGRKALIGEGKHHQIDDAGQGLGKEIGAV